MAFQSQFASMELIRWIEQFDQATLFTYDKMWILDASLVSAIEVASGLLVVLNIEDLFDPVEELGLSAAVGPMDDNCIGLVFLSKN